MPVVPRVSARYDGVLAALPASLAGGTTAGWILSVPLVLGVGVGGLLAAALLALALFVAPP